MTIKVQGERYAVVDGEGAHIGEVQLEDDSYYVILEESVSSADLRELLRVVERIEKENGL